MSLYLTSTMLKINVYLYNKFIINNYKYNRKTFSNINIFKVIRYSLYTTLNKHVN